MADHHPLQHRNYSVIFRCRLTTHATPTGGGVALIFHNSIRYVERTNIHADCEIILADVNTTSLTLTIGSHHAALNGHSDIDHLTTILISHHLTNLFICGDFNAHHPSWNQQSNSDVINRVRRAVIRL